MLDGVIDNTSFIIYLMTLTWLGGLEPGVRHI